VIFLASYEEVNFVNFRATVQQLLQENLAHKAGSASDENDLILVIRLNFTPLFVHRLYKKIKYMMNEKERKKRKNTRHYRFDRVACSYSLQYAPIYSICDEHYKLERIGVNRSMRREQTL